MIKNRWLCVAFAWAAGAGLALKPKTPASAALPYLDDLDLVLVMTVEPGFGGQGFLSGMLGKIRELRRHLDRRGSRAVKLTSKPS